MSPRGANSCRCTVRRGLAIYEKSDSPYWWADVSYNGKRKRLNTRKRLRRDAEEAAWRFYNEAVTAAGRPGRREGDDLALLAGLDLNEAVARGVGVRQQTSVQGCWNHVCRLLGADTDPAKVTFDLVVQYVATRRAAGARGQSIAKEVQALKRGLKIARRRGSIEALPEEWPTIRRDTPDKKKRGKLHPMAVVHQWLAQLQVDSPPAWRQAEVAIRTGLRAEELRALTWEWVESAPDGAGVPAMLRVPAEAAKTRRERMVGLTPTALRVLNEARQVVDDWSEPLLTGDYRKRFTNARKAIGYDHTITLRDLRHCHATWSAQGTGDAAATQAALGHTDLRTTQRYLSATLARTASAASAVESALGDVAATTSVTPSVTANCHDGLSRSTSKGPETKNLAATKVTARSMLSQSRPFWMRIELSGWTRRTPRLATWPMGWRTSGSGRSSRSLRELDCRDGSPPWDEGHTAPLTLADDMNEELGQFNASHGVAQRPRRDDGQARPAWPGSMCVARRADTARAEVRGKILGSATIGHPRLTPVGE